MTTTEQSIREALEYAQTSTNIPGMAKHHIYTLCQLLERQTESKHAAGSSIPDALILEDEPEPDSKETIAYVNGWNDFRIHVLKALSRPPANTSGLAFVMEAVRNERVRQDGKWGGPEHDDTNSPAFFVQLIQDYAGWARVMIGMNSPDKYRRRMIQVAALAVASVESLDRTQNRSPNQEG